MNKKEIGAIKFLLEDSYLSRNGSYGINAEIFFIALKEYLVSGVNVLTEHDKLTYLSWDNNWSKEDLLLFEKALNNETFWNIRSMYDDKKINELQETYSQVKFYLENQQSYKNRRKKLFTNSLKKSIKIRDKYKCQKCKKDISNEKCAIHHKIKLIDGGDNDPSNLITLCIPCHKLIHRSKKND